MLRKREEFDIFRFFSFYVRDDAIRKEVSYALFIPASKRCGREDA